VPRERGWEDRALILANSATRTESSSLVRRIVVWPRLGAVILRLCTASYPAAVPLPLPLRSVAARYAAAVTCVAAALGLTMAARHFIAPQVSLLFYAAVVLGAWAGGLGPGLLATLLAVASLDFFFLGPRYAFGGFSARDAIDLVVFASIAALTSALNSALAGYQRKTADAEAATRAKSAFLAAVSHDLRSPLHAILGYAELIGSGAHGPVTPEQRRDLDRIVYCQRHLLSLITDLLDIAQIEAGTLPLHLAPLRAADAIARAIALVEPQLREKGLTLVGPSADALPPVRADADRLIQILVNLLGNAVKFTDAGLVGIQTSAARDVVAITVWDTGPGIPLGDERRIFDPFVQGASGPRPSHGAGLGLAISRDLARAMRGDLTLAPRPERGAAFTLTLPRADLEHEGVTPLPTAWMLHPRPPAAPIRRAGGQ
jgi:signal transduction histidine kinase